MSTSQLERLDQVQQQHLLRAKLVLDACEKESRPLTADEEKSVTTNMAAVADLDKRIAQLQTDANFGDHVNQLIGAGGTRRPVRGVAGSAWGDQFLAGVGDFFKLGNHRRGGAWASPSVEMFATTISEDPASGGSVVPPDVQPNIIPLPTRRLVVADLLAPGTTTSNNVQFMAEKTFTNAAAPTLEAGVKPESTLIFELKSAPVRKIAHWVPATEEILEDVGQMRSYIDQRLRLGVQLAEDDQLLNGDGVAPNLLGLLNQVGLAPDVPRGTDSAADAIAKQIAAIATTSNLAPDGVIMHPSDYLGIQLAKTSGSGEYLGSGPFAAPGPASLWGLPAALTVAIPVGTALVGAFRIATQLFRHGGIRVDATNSHADFFVKNLVAIRGEERAALAVYRAAAIGKVTGLGPTVP